MNRKQVIPILIAGLLASAAQAQYTTVWTPSMSSQVQGIAGATGGYWFTFKDTSSTSVIVPVSGAALISNITANKGLNVSYTMGGAVNSYGAAGFSFLGTGLPYDVSAYKGLCVTSTGSYTLVATQKNSLQDGKDPQIGVSGTGTHYVAFSTLAGPSWSQASYTQFNATLVEGFAFQTTTSASFSFSEVGLTKGSDCTGAGSTPVSSVALSSSSWSTSSSSSVAMVPDGNPHFHLFLLFGQSNMEGVPAPEAIDQVTDPRIQVLAYNNCANLARTYDDWYTASPPLHSCYMGVGPGDYFAKTLLPMIPAGDTIGLIPCAIAGVDIDFFRKGIVSARRSQFVIPPDNTYSGAYQFMIDRINLARQHGKLEGILFHQGESNVGDATWPSHVNEIVTNLRADLGAPNIPFVAGEVVYNACCSSMNTYEDQLPTVVSNAALVSANVDPSVYWSASAQGLAMYTTDGLKAHFSLESQREMGKRYAQKMAALLPKSVFTGATSVKPTANTATGFGFSTVHPNRIAFHTDTPRLVTLNVYKTSGERVRSLYQGEAHGETSVALTGMLPPGFYIFRLTSGADVHVTSVVVAP